MSDDMFDGEGGFLAGERRMDSIDAQVVNAGRDAVALAHSYHCEACAGGCGPSTRSAGAAGTDGATRWSVPNAPLRWTDLTAKKAWRDRLAPVGFPRWTAVLLSPAEAPAG